MNKEQAQIDVLRFPENVRLRHGMYLTNPDQCIFEMVDNSIDEHAAGRCDTITVKIIGEEVMVADNGSGIPITPSEDPEYKGVPQAEIAYTVLHAGGKFGSEGGYKTNTGGMNGVGASCVNAVSEYTNLIIRTGGIEYQIDFAKGKTIKKLYETNNKINKSDSGTEVHFKLDKSIWKDEWYNFTNIKNRLKQLAYLNPKLTINLEYDSFTAEDKEVKLKETYSYPEGLIGYINNITEGKEQVIEPEYVSKQVQIEDNKNVDVEIAFVYTNSYSSDIKSFVNNVGTEYGGDHETGFKTGVFGAIKRYALENEIIKTAKDIESADCREGMQSIVSVKLKDPNFEGQGKGKLRMTEVRASVKDVIEDFLFDYLAKDNQRAKVIIDKVLAAARARDAAKRARNAARGIKKIVSGGMVENFANCSCKEPEKCEIFLVEGDSAGGSAKQARDRKYQAILPIFGKILNAEKSTFDKVVNSTKLIDMVKALRTGIGDEFDLSKLRYHRVILLADADVDGKHIQCLHMTNMFRTMRPLIENGHLFVACPPLFKVTKGKGKNATITYLYTKEELDAFDTTGCLVSRYKGLGEMNPDQLWETTMNPETRKLIQVTIEDLEEAEKALVLCMGKDVSARRDFLLENI